MKIFKFIITFCLLTSQSLIAEEDVGVIITLSGEFAKYGEKVQSSIRRIKSPNIKYIFEDEGCSPNQAIKSYQKLTNINGIKLFIGPWCGSPQSAMAPMIKKSKQLAILGSSSPRNLYQKSDGRMFSTQPSIEQESIFNAKTAYKIGSRKAVILFFDNDFSRAHEAAFRKTYQGEILETLTYNSFDASVLKLLALKIKRLNPDTLYLPDAYPLVHGLLKELDNINVTNLKIFSVYSAEFSEVLEMVGKEGEGLLYSYPKIGDRNALEYYPEIAAEIVNNLVEKCGSKDIDCALKILEMDYDFNEFGVLEGEVGLKTIKDGAFTWYN